MDARIEKLTEHGQSLWLDFIDREMLETGKITAWLKMGVRGMTSNPSIFKKAIADGKIYDGDIRELAQADHSPMEIYEALAVEDIQRAADNLRPLYDATDGADGYISLEVSPFLANDTEETLKEVKRLHGLVDRPNLMVKIPATEAGIPAIEQAVRDGVNVNVTLIISRSMYEKVMDAYLSGLEARAEAGEDLSGIHSVASFFISRVDVLVDKMLNERIEKADTDEKKAKLESLKGQAGIANGKLAYDLFKEHFGSERFRALEGANLQRPLWASTSVKDPAYTETMYVDALIGPDTVNTAPPKTIEAFTKSDLPIDRTVDEGTDEARSIMAELAAASINMEAVTAQLLEEGVEKFTKPFQALLDTIEEKSSELVSE